MNHEEADRLFDEAAKSFKSSKKALDEDVKRLREWLETQPHLPKILGTHALRNFLILNKCSIEVTKQKIDNYYTFRTKLPEIVQQINPKLSHHTEFNKAAYLVQHPRRTDEMYALLFFKVKGETLPESYEPINFMRRCLTIQEVRLREDVMFGDVFVVDLKGFPLNIALKITPSLILKGNMLYEKIFSARLKAVHVINMAPPLVKVLLVLKNVIKSKLFERFHIYPEHDDLKEVIRSDLLPVDFGGEGLSLQALENMWEAKYGENEELFDSLDKIEIDETLRPERLEDDEFLGYYGNFKKIDID